MSIKSIPAVPVERSPVVQQRVEDREVRHAHRGVHHKARFHRSDSAPIVHQTARPDHKSLKDRVIVVSDDELESDSDISVVSDGEISDGEIRRSGSYVGESADDRIQREELVLDAVTSEPLAEPVIDSCGHTLNRATFNGMPRMKNGAGEDIPNVVVCPFSRQPVFLDRLIRNLYARNASDYISSRAAAHADLHRVIRQHEEYRAEMRVQNEKLARINAVARQQVQNFLDMTFCDRLAVMCDSRMLLRIQQRNGATLV